MATIYTASARTLKRSLLLSPKALTSYLSSTAARHMSDPTKSKSESEWRAVLSKEQVQSASSAIQPLTHISTYQFRILREKGTEPAGTGKYDKFYKNGVYSCAGCGTPLYESTTKFNSGCGWPAFFDGMHIFSLSAADEILIPHLCTAIPGAVSRQVDKSWGRERIEITCTACGGHLGHVFQGEGFNTPSTFYF
jgi:peptide-methionine (R)-S-oxide reductase